MVFSSSVSLSKLTAIFSFVLNFFKLSSCKTSSAHKTTLAPSCKSLLVPAEVVLVIGPGTAKTSRLASKACLAVIKAPPSILDSITNVPNDKPAIIRFLAGKFCLKASVPAGYSESIRLSFFNISMANGSFILG